MIEQRTIALLVIVAPHRGLEARHARGIEGAQIRAPRPAGERCGASSADTNAIFRRMLLTPCRPGRHCIRSLKRDAIASRLGSLFEHDLFGKPLRIFPDHA
jgi:hypothetical protein